MNAKRSVLVGFALVASLALALLWHLESVYGQQGGAGGAGGGGRGGGAGGAGGLGGGGRGGVGGSPGFAIPSGGSPGAVSATSNFVYVVHNDTLYQFGAQDLALVNRVSLDAPMEKKATPRARQ